MATPTRRNVLKLVFIAPAVFMLGVAVQSKPNYLDYDHMISDSEVDMRVTNYIGVVKATEALFATGQPDPERARQIAGLWISEAEAGKLKPLPSQGVDDTMQSGVKNQIGSAAKDLSHTIRRWAMMEADNGEYGKAVKDFILSIRVIQPLRYSDISSIAMIDNHQRRTLHEIKKIWPNLTAGQKTSMKEVLHEMTPDTRQFDEVVRADRRLEVVHKIQTEDIAHAMPKGVEEDSTPRPLDATLLVKVATSNERANQKLIDELLR